MQPVFSPTRSLAGLAAVTVALTALTAATPPMAVAATTSASACLNGYSGPYAVVLHLQQHALGVGRTLR